MKKKTQELLNQLKETDSISCYLKAYGAELLDRNFKAYLEQLIAIKPYSKREIIERSGLHEIYAYQIFAGKRSPSRDKVIALCFGMGLNVEEAQHLLNRAGVAELYPRDRRDSIILFALKEGLSVMECDELLYEMEEYILK